ncbi:MAG: hypothetical protein U0T79_11175 [Ferruginibacter sp.]
MIDKEGTEESKKKLWSLVSIKAMEELKSFTEKDASRFINAVHELNLEQHIIIQANEFYKNFPFSRIGMDDAARKQMIADFVEMEHCKRRDDFYRFCVACYQQVENIVNNIFIQGSLWDKAKTVVLSEKTEILNPGKTQGKWKFLLSKNLLFPGKGETLNDVFITKYLSSTPTKFSDRFKLLLYFVYFNERVTYNQWITTYDFGSKLYSARNKVHRGVPDWPEQEKKVKEIYDERYKYYLLFPGFLADLIQKINITYHSEGAIV